MPEFFVPGNVPPVRAAAGQIGGVQAHRERGREPSPFDRGHLRLFVVITRGWGKIGQALHLQWRG